MHENVSKGGSMEESSKQIIEVFSELEQQSLADCGGV